MSLDSTAELLFHIGADSDDAEENIQRFRTLLSKDLGDLRGEFAAWSEEVFGEMTTVKGALLGLTAAAGAGVVALGGFLLESAKKYEEYAGEIAQASKMTGISAENMSVLGVAAKTAGVSVETLTNGMTFLERAVGMAAAGEEQARRGFEQLHITQAQLAAGQKDIMPLLELVAERFHGLSKGAAQTTVAMELFSRGGRELIPFLNELGAEGLKKVEERAKELGVVIGEKDVQAYEQHRIAMTELHETMEGFEIQLGSKVLPHLNDLLAYFIALPVQLEMSASIIDDWGRNFAHLAKNLAAEGESVYHALTFQFSAAGKDLETAGTELMGMEAALNSITDTSKHFGTATEEAFKKAKEELATLAALVHGKGGSGGIPNAMDGLTDAEKKAIQEIEKELQEFIRLQGSAQTKMLQGARQLYEQQHANAGELAADLLNLRTIIQGLNTVPRHIEPVHMDQSFEQMKQSIAEVTRKEQEMQEAFERDSRRMSEAIIRVQRSHETAYERLAADYKEDLEKCSYAEEAKAAAAVKGTEHEMEVHQQYAAMRAALLTKYGNDLQQLYNSQGWQNIFGSKFAQQLKGDQAALKEWATSANQSILLVKDATAMLGQQAKEAFDQFANGMGQGIAQAMVYSKSITQAMRAAVAATLESIAAKDIVLALDATAWGFYDLAMGDYAGAASAFEAAALFGAVGGAAGIAGRFAAPSSQTGAGSQGGRAGAGAGGYGSQGPGASTPIQQAGPGVHVYVQGNLVGWQNIDELTSAINDAVLNRDVTLTATNTTTGVQVVHG
ncbi:MAG TPA: hypothetical protein VH640_25945 [Bryobacteraceae bacterium]